MWKFLASSILRNRLTYTAIVLILSAFVGWEASKMQLSYEFAKILPDNDSTQIEYTEFKKQCGEDGNVMVMGFRDTNFFQFEKFRDWHELGKNVKAIQGIKDIISLTNIFRLERNDSLEKFEFFPLVTRPITSQAQVDTLKEQIHNLP